MELVARLFNHQTKEIKDRLAELLTDLNLEEKQHALAMNLSGGQQKRLSIMMALIHTPQILLLDEPFAGLDFQSCNIIRHYLRKLHGLDLTIIFSTHNFDDIQSLCDQVAILNKGKLVAYGPPSKIVESWIGDQLLIEWTTPAINQLRKVLQQVYPDFQEINQQLKNDESGGMQIVKGVYSGNCTPESPRSLVIWVQT